MSENAFLLRAHGQGLKFNVFLCKFFKANTRFFKVCFSFGCSVIGTYFFCIFEKKLKKKRFPCEINFEMFDNRD